MRAKLIYIAKAIGRRARFGLGDALRRGDRDGLPPRHLSFVGGGDFVGVGRGFLDQFVALGGLTPDDDVLDIGCGIGRMAIPLTDYLVGGTYRGFDVGREMIRWNQRHITPAHPDFQFTWAPVYNQKYSPFGTISAVEYRFPYADDSFDFVLATSLFTHLVPDEVRHYLAETARVLRPGGRAFLTFFLLTDTAREEIRAGRADFDFSYPVGEALAVDPRAPEEAIAYDAEDLSRFLAEVGMRLVRPPYLGSWSNSPGAPSVQDLVIAERADERGSALDSSSMSASPESPLHGRCGCGAVRFEVSAPFESARYCHCHNCQRRTGTSSSANARVQRRNFHVLDGEELIRSWQPEGGQGKFYCRECGGHLYSSAEDSEHVFVRLGAIEEDPGIRPEYRQWLSSAVPWERIPDDGLPRFDGPGHP